MPDEIKKIILSNKSNGFDKISHRMIIPILNYLLPAISDIVNSCLHSGSFPSLWCYAYVIPSPKKPNHKHFRPISILTFLSELLETCVYKQLSQCVYHNEILCPLRDCNKIKNCGGFNNIVHILELSVQIKRTI